MQNLDSDSSVVTPAETFPPVLSFSEIEEQNEFFDRVDAERNLLADPEIERLWIEEMIRRDATTAA